ncbi:MAG: beta-glucuronidase, partial [Melioribacteraceae bacterium]|nr:beta-glucuronidase [Melioribacteraceae bacterium]
PKNFEIFKETLSTNNLADLADKFLIASGRLQSLCYKADIEAALRTPRMAGFQLLDLHDFPGQGTALIGILDAFWDEKGYISPESFRHFCNTTVPLARFSKRVFMNSEVISIGAEVAHFGERILEEIVSTWRVNDGAGATIFEGKFEPQNIPIDNEVKLGKLIWI